MRVCTRRERRRQVHQKLKLIATVQQTQPTIQLLLSTSDFVGALDLITTTQDVLQQELQGVHSLRWVAGITSSAFIGSLCVELCITSFSIVPNTTNAYYEMRLGSYCRLHT